MEKIRIASAGACWNILGKRPGGPKISITLIDIRSNHAVIRIEGTVLTHLKGVKKSDTEHDWLFDGNSSCKLAGTELFSVLEMDQKQQNIKFAVHENECMFALDPADDRSKKVLRLA